MNVDRMRRNLRRRWIGLPQKRVFTEAEVEQNQRAILAWEQTMEDPGPAPINDWVAKVRRHNPDSVVRSWRTLDGGVVVAVRAR